MIEFLLALRPWHWLCLALFLLILEIFGAGGFLLGIGIGALAVAGLLALLPALAWHWQFVLFAALSVIFTLIYWKKFRHFNEASEQPLLNSRVQRLVGRKVPLLTATQHGVGKVQIEDALWSVACNQDLAAGTLVKITGAEGMTLSVEPLPVDA